MQAVVIAWLAWEVTKSGDWVGAIGFAEFMPIALIAPFSGSFVNKLGPRKIILASQMIGILHSTLLIFILRLGGLSPLNLLCLAILIGLIDGCFHPANLAITGELVEKSLLSSAAVVNSAVQNFCFFLGPLAAGVLLTMFSPLYACLTSLACRVLFMVAIGKISSRSRGYNSVHEQAGRISVSDDGWKFFFSNNQTSAILIGCASVSLTARALIPVLSAFVGETLHEGSEMFAAGVGLIGAGAMAGSFLQGGERTELGCLKLVRNGLLYTAASLFGLAIFRSPEVVLLVLFSLGLTIGVNGTGTQAYIQMTSFDKPRGKIFGIYVMVLNGSVALGGLFIGSASSYLGSKWVLVACAVLCVAAALIVTISWRNARK